MTPSLHANTLTEYTVSTLTVLDCNCVYSKSVDIQTVSQRPLGIQEFKDSSVIYCCYATHGMHNMQWYSLFPTQ